jgi:PAS domain S-box-containing protein
MPAQDPRLVHYASEANKKVLSLWIIFDDAGKIVLTASRTPELLGYSSEELVGMDLRSIIKTEDMDKFQQIKEQIKTGGKNIENLELDISHKRGHIMTFGLQMFAVQGMEGELHFCMNGADITTYKDNQWAIEMMNKKLNILGSATRHDVLNSLTGLFGYLELAEVKCKDENVTKFIRKAKSSAETVKKQIEFTRAYQELGSKKPSWIKVNDVIRMSYAALNDPRLPAQVDVDDLEVFADPMLEKVFYNIMDNAQRHAEAKEMHISFHRRGNEGELIISDDGRGVPENEKEFIFKRGYGKNTGFGLYLSREILEITGIKIVENGEEGKGARFVITIPHMKFRGGM